jgi:nucleotide-binding universal stress UspA family protein
LPKLPQTYRRRETAGSREVRLMTSIVVGFVDRPEGHAALARAIAEAARHGVRLVVAHGRPQPAGIGSGAVPDADESAAHLGQALADATVEYDVVDLPVTDSYAEALVALADETAADMIVIGLRRRSPVGKLVLGSNAQRILLDATCPVLAVKAGVGPAVAGAGAAGARRTVHDVSQP